MDLSIVIPVYNEVEALPSLYVALVETLDRLNKSAEIRVDRRVGPLP